MAGSYKTAPTAASAKVVSEERSSLSSPSEAWGGVAVFGDGGVKSIVTVAFDPSVRDYADTSPTSLGRKKKSATEWRAPSS
ncbi:hypothetical protein [Reyranella sp.]|uniref:hypothetical protein n=1 Tax=Reyranella sp. TaxID=1929291 RepID=UPI003784840C